MSYNKVATMLPKFYPASLTRSSSLPNECTLLSKTSTLMEFITKTFN